MLKLKRVDLPVYALAQTGASWLRRGWDAELETPPPGGIWLPLADADGRWQGWVRLHDWLENAAPELAGLALSVGIDAQVVQWFSAIERPVAFPMPELAYQRLCIGEPITREALPCQPLLRVMGCNGPVWLVRAPASTDGEMTLPSGLSWPLRVVVGESNINLGLLGQVGCGDILLVTKAVPEVRCYAATLGTYQQSEEGIIMEAEKSQGVQEEVNVVRDMRQLPVQLEFVLHSRRMTLAELQNLYQGHLFALPAEAELRVEIRGNGARLGYGELVQLDNQLGVEVNEWLSESCDGE
ncbi:YscQ/HrcQ family type III secretion apparatus protein [Obesumbacterium proteus]|uniref:YscQ/HrcQ family type III secretion apparatus protein n=1 Tax=Obesumbacterium proteus TaxID=82983 RepID=UPI0024317939|nr:YscQ/HrcQ family type III secretion apparatus protein [Obesumbacterium proteus]